MSENISTDAIIGAVLGGKYRVTGMLGRGGIGAVYIGEHTLIKRPVAIKVLHPHLVEDENFLARFRHEAEIASKLNHPNAVIIYDFGVEENRPYLVMEYVQGITLKEWLVNNPKFALSELIQIIGQAASALSEAHRAGIIHRDLKPDNIMVTVRAEGCVSAKVLDFGIAKLIHDQGEKGATVVTQAGTFFGTPRYASPEQILGRELSNRSDLYSLGVIVYEALAGEPPFDAPSTMEVFLKHLNQEPPLLRKFDRAKMVSPDLEKAVMRCLEKEPVKRFDSAVEFAAALEQAAASSSREHDKKKAAKRLAAAGAGAAAMIIALVCLLYFAVWSKTAVKTMLSLESVPPGAQVFLEGKYLATTPASLRGLKEQNYVFTFRLGQYQDQVQAIDIKNDAGNSLKVIMQSVSPLPDASVEPAAVPSPSLLLPAVEGASAQPGVQSTPILGAAVIEPSPAPAVESSDGRKIYREAMQLYRSREYKPAAEKLAVVVSQKADHLEARLALGNCYLRLRRYAEAIEQFSKALEIDKNYGPVYYNLACYYAVTGDSEKALGFLEKTFALDSRARQAAGREPDLESLQNLPRFRRMLSQ